MLLRIATAFPFPAVLISLLGVVSPAAIRAQDDALPWLQKMLTLYEKAPFSLDFTLDAKIPTPQGGSTFDMEGSGSVLYLDQTHMRMTMAVTTAFPGADSPMEMKLFTVADGQHIWSEIDNPMMGAKQVMKMSLADVEAAASKAGMMGLLSGGADPISSLRKLQEVMTFVVIDAGGDPVVLEGTPNETMRQQLTDAPEGLREGKLRLAIDRESGAPRWMTLGPPESPVMKMTFEAVSFLGASGTPEGSFSYTPPPGVQVIEPLAQPAQSQP